MQKHLLIGENNLLIIYYIILKLVQLADMGRINDVYMVMDIENFDWAGEYPDEIIYDYNDAETWFENFPRSIEFGVID